MKEIAFKRDIIEEVAERLEMPLEKIENTFNFLIFRLREMTKDPEIVNIRLPYLGYFHKKIHGEPFKFKKVSEMRHSIEKYGERSGKNAHQKPKRIETVNFTNGHSLENLEIIQNKFADGSKDPNNR